MLNLEQRLTRHYTSERKLKPVGIRLFETMIDDLKFLAELRGGVCYQGIARSLIAQGIREELEFFAKMSPEDRKKFMDKHETSQEIRSLLENPNA